MHYSNQGAKIQKHEPVFVNCMEWNFLICLMLYRVCKSVALDLKDNRPIHAPMNIKPGPRVLDAFPEWFSRRHHQQQLSLEEGLTLKLPGVTNM